MNNLLKQSSEKLTQLATRENIILVLKIACITLFLGRAWQYIFRDAPYREIFWNDHVIEPFLDYFNYSKKKWFLTSDPYITKFIQFIGLTYIACAFSSFKIKTFRSIHTLILVWGAANLLFLTYLIYLSKLATLGMFIEHTIQWATPLFLILYLTNPGKALLVFMKIAIALTFTGHGLYAAGYYTVPGDFVSMVIGSTPIENWETAMVFLKIAGILDFILSVAIFIPKIHIQLYCLGYAFFWGILTAFARIVAFFDPHMFAETTSAWLHQTVFRFPHGLIPLACLLMILASAKVRHSGSPLPSQ